MCFSLDHPGILFFHANYQHNIIMILMPLCFFSVQHQLGAARKLEVEMEEVRSQLESEREGKERLLAHLTHLEKDNVNLTSRLEELFQQVSLHMFYDLQS